MHKLTVQKKYRGSTKIRFLGSVSIIEIRTLKEKNQLLYCEPYGFLELGFQGLNNWLV